MGSPRPGTVTTRTPSPGWRAGYRARGIEGSLDLPGALPEDVAAFGCRRGVGGEACVADHDEPADFAGLGALLRVEGGVYVQDHAPLTGLSGRGTFDRVRRDLRIRDNAAPTRLSGLDSRSRDQGGVLVYDHVNLRADEVEALVAPLTSFAGTVTNEGNTGTRPASSSPAARRDPGERRAVTAPGLGEPGRRPAGRRIAPRPGSPRRAGCHGRVRAPPTTRETRPPSSAGSRGPP